MITFNYWVYQFETFSVSDDYSFLELNKRKNKQKRKRKEETKANEKKGKKIPKPFKRSFSAASKIFHL